MLALFLAQIWEGESKLAIYGPMGVICLWLMYREEKSRDDISKEKDLIRADNAGLRDEIRGLAHQIKVVNRNLLYVTASHGPEGLRQVAQRELDQMMKHE